MVRLMNGRSMLNGHYVPAPLYLLRGALFLWNHRELWKFAAAPLAISCGILGISSALLYRFIFHLAEPYQAGEWYWRILSYGLAIIVTLLVILVSCLVVTRVASVLSSPFNEIISYKTEELVRGAVHDAPFSLAGVLRDSARSISHSFKILAINVIFLGAGLLLLLIPVVGSLLFTVLGALLSAYLFTYEYLGYPMDRRRFSFAEKRRFLRESLRSTIEFGLGNVAVASIPVLNIFLIPCAVAGGTILFLELHRDRSDASGGGPVTNDRTMFPLRKNDASG